jgi:transcriptional regulator with XRE-family HTH domain
MVKSRASATVLEISAEHLQSYRAGRLTLKKLAEVHGVSVTTIWRELKRRGVYRGSRRGRPPNRQKHPLIIELAAQGLSRRQIAERVGVTPEWVRCILAEHGLSVSLRILKCRQCGKTLTSGHKAEQNPDVLCASCLSRHSGYSFGQRLRSLRLAANLSRAELSARCGLSQALLGNYERDEGQPTEESLGRLAQGLGVKVETVLGEKILA